MQIPQTKTQRTKAAIHLFQALLIFVAGCLTLAVMTKSGSFGAQTGFYFALCFLTFPAIIYLVMVPMWSRAWRFNNVWAIATIDILFAILWFAASIAVAVWNADGIAKGKTDSSSDGTDKSTKREDTTTKKDGTCASFGYGSETKCKVSKATVGFGIIVFLLFAVTSYLAVRAIIQYRKTGVVPSVGMKNHGSTDALGTDDPSKDPWSANIDEQLHTTSDDRLTYGQQTAGDDSEALLHRNSESDSRHHADGMAHPGRRLSHQGSAQFASPPTYDGNFAPSALSPTGIPTSLSGHVAFPEADYNALR
ncbi:hypothetical protein BST61_czeina44g000420 [Lecanosticta acicola]|uniref:MARVEL domain-containing protein n=1 Tax=Lecanosticta acicola TaxID=111012 RepID=A0AAI8Z1X4_9PEZI|nr:hypothetical protein BST61_czeina44g000420 [Lecanosticta acicola]